jgi:hypothetical protein
MAQYREGQRLKGSDGNIYVVTNGVPVRASSPFAKPTLPYEGPQAAANLQRTRQEIAQAQAQADADTRAKKAAAAKAELDLKNAQEAYDAAHPKTKGDGPFGPAFLQTLPPADQEIVKALADGRLPFPTSFALRSPYWQTKIQQVAQFDPTFDATNYNTRAKARASIANGPLGKSNNALNTAMGHLGTLYDQVNGTASHGGFPFATTVNAVENEYLRRRGDKGITNFMDTASKLADELEAAYRGSNGAEAGVVRQLKNLDPNMSYEQKIGVIQNAVDLLASKMAANLSQFNVSTGGTPTWDMLDPHAKQVLQRIAPGAVEKYFAPPQGLSRSAEEELLGNSPPEFKSAIAAAAGSGGGAPPGGNPPPGGGGPIDRTNFGGMSPITGGSGVRSAPDPAASALIDSLVSSNTPYGPAIRQFREQFPNATPLAPSQYNAALAYHSKHPNETTGYGAATQDIPLSYGDQFANALVGSAPGALATRANDALFGALPSALAGDKGQYFRAITSQQHPVASTLGDIAGTVAGTIGVGKGLKAAAPLLSDFSPAATKLLSSPGSRNLIADTTFGGVYGGAQNPDNPVAGTLAGVSAMVAGNGIGRLVLGPGLAAAGNSRLGKAALGMFGASPTPALPSAEGEIVRQAGGNSNDILANLDEAANLNLPYSLADANPQLRMLAGSAVRKSPVVRQLAEDTIAPRQLGQADRAIAAIDTHLAPITNIEQRGSDLLAAGDDAAAPSYAMAFSRPGPVDPHVAAMLDTPAGKASLAHARTIAANEGIDPNKIGFGLNDLGEVTLESVPSFKTLQLVKRGLDTHLNSFADQFGNLNLRGNPMAQSVLDLKNRFNSRLGEINPSYAEGNTIWSGYAGRKNALDLGYNTLSNNAVPFRQFETSLSGLNDSTLPEAQMGFATSMADAANKARMTADPYKVVYGSPLQQQKVAAIFPEGAPTFGRINALEGDMSRTANETLGGSPTAARMEADKLFENGPANLAGDIAFTAATGAPTPGLIKTGFRTMAGDAFRLGLGKSAQNKAEQLGPMLLNTDPAASATQLRQLIDLAAARREYMARARAAGGMFGAPLAAPFISN